MNAEITQEMREIIKKAETGNIMMNAERLECVMKTLLSGDIQPGELVLELGTYVGKTAQMMRSVLDILGLKNDIISVDNISIPTSEPRTPVTTLQQAQQWMEKNFGRNILVIESTHTFWKHFVGEVAVLTIDAGHDYEDVREDIRDYVGFVKNGGTIYCDDYWAVKKFHPGVMKAVDEMLKNNDKYELISQVEGGISFRKK